MLNKKQEYIAEALDEIRDIYIEEAVAHEEEANLTEVFEVISYESSTKKRRRRFYQVAGTLVACFVVVIALVLTSGELRIGGSADVPAGSGDGVSAGGAAGGSAQDMTDDTTSGAGEQQQADTENTAGTVEPGQAPENESQATGNEDLQKAEFKGVIKAIETVYETECTYIVISTEVLHCMTGDLQVHEVYDIWISADIDQDLSAKQYLEELEYDKEYIFTSYLGEDGRWKAYRPD